MTLDEYYEKENKKAFYGSPKFYSPVNTPINWQISGRSGHSGRSGQVMAMRRTINELRGLTESEGNSIDTLDELTKTPVEDTISDTSSSSST